MSNPNLLKSFIAVNKSHDFPIQNLPFGIFSYENEQKKVGVAIGDYVLDLEGCYKNNLFKQMNFLKLEHFQQHLNPLMALEKSKFKILRNAITELLSEHCKLIQDNPDLRKKLILPMKSVTLHLPAAIGGYTDFYSSKAHASHLGAMFRDKNNPLLPNWVHMPVAYDGRAGSIVVSGTNFHRPKGQVKKDTEDHPSFQPSNALDLEVEMGFFVGRETALGQSVSMAQAPEHIFGLVLLNDWSARDIQKWEYVPLGPFLGKNFCTSISPWVVTLEALEPFRVSAPEQIPAPLNYLKRLEDWALDIHLELSIQTQEMAQPVVVAKMNFKEMYWDLCQQLTHHSVNGCPMKTGDLLGSGTISNEEPQSSGSLIELTMGGQQSLKLTEQVERKYLQDGDTVIIRGYCQGDGYRIGFGEVKGTVLPAFNTIEATMNCVSP